MPGGEQRQGVVERIGAQHDEIGRLFELFAGASVDIDHAPDLLGLFVVDETVNVGLGPQLEFLVLPQYRQDARRRAGFGIGLAAEEFAVAAILALTERQPLGIGIGRAGVGGGRRERMMAETLRGLGEDQAACAMISGLFG